MPIKNLLGLVFGRLTVIAEAGRTSQGGVLWSCQCSCGNIVVVRSSVLLNGNTQSCGCLQRERASQAQFKHGMSNTLIYQIWQGKMQVCYNPNHPAYDRYGGRGIRVCERWHSFENFYTDVGDPPKGKSLDRYPNNDGHYEPGNWRWATSKEQNNNKSNNIVVEYNGRKWTLTELGEELGISPTMLNLRLRRYGWSLEKAISVKAKHSTKYTYNNETLSLADWSRKTGIPFNTLSARVFTLHWSIEKTLTTPVRLRRSKRAA